MTIRTYIAMFYAVAAMLATAFAQPAHAAEPGVPCTAPAVGATIHGNAAIVTLTETSGDWSHWSLPAVFLMTAVEVADLPDIAELAGPAACTDDAAAQISFAIPVHMIDRTHTVVLPVAWNQSADALDADNPAHFEVHDWPAYLSASDPQPPALEVAIDSDRGFQRIWSDTHDIDITAFDGRRVVTLAPDQLAGPDMFVLHYILENEPALASAGR